MQLFRLLSAQPQKDGEAWKIRGQFHQDAWYEDAYGQNPEPFRQQAPGSGQSRPPYPWQPASEHIATGDAMYPGAASFSVGLDVSSYPAQITLSGVLPVNVPPTASAQAPIVPLQGTTSNTGGSIPAGTYVAAISLDSAGPLSHITTIVVPAGTSTNTVAISGIEWPNDGTHHTTSQLYIGTSILNLRSAGFAGLGWTGSSPDSNGNPTVATATFIPLQSGGPPDINFQKFIVQEFAIEHGGIWGDVVTSVVSGSGTQNLYFAGSGAAWTINQWAGYVLSLYGNSDIRQPVRNYVVASNTADTLTVTGMLTADRFNGGDVVVLRAKSGHVTANTIGDDNFINNYAPSGLAVNAEAGRLIVIIAGKGAGQPPKSISSNTATVLTIAQPWDVTPDSTSVWIVISPAVAYEYKTAAVTNDGTFSVAVPVATAPAITAEAQQLLVQVATADANDNYFPMRYQPFREVYVPPQNTGGSDGAVYTVPNASNVFTPDLARGLNQKVVLIADSVINPPMNAPAGSSVTWTLIIDQDATGGHNAVLDPKYFYSVNILGTAAPSTRSQSTWIHDQSDHDSISYIITDQPIPA